MTRSREARWVASLALLALVLVVYIPVLRTGGFIWDDPQYITGNPLLRTWPGLLAIWIHPSALPQYYPLVHTTFWLEYQLVGLHPFLYHIDNIVLHAIAAILLWRALARLNIPAPWLAAAIFALHPVQVESVAWPTERKNVLSLVFYLLSFHAYWSFTQRRRAGDYVLALLLFVAALLSKSVTCSLPAAILLIVYWKNGRLRRADIAPLIPFFLLGAVMAAVTAVIEKQHVGASGPEWNLTILDRCLIAGRALWFYASKLAWPHPLVFIYPRWEEMSFSQRPWLIAFPLAAVAVIVSVWLLRKRIGRGPLVCLLFFVGTLVPALGFINLYPMRYSFVADHFQYHASIGLIVLAAVGLRHLRAIGCGIILAVLGTLTWQQGYLYQNQLVLWRDTVEHNPHSWMAWGNLGDEYAALSVRADLPESERKQDRTLARGCYVELYKLAPDQPLAHLKWGIVKEYDGDLSAAESEFEKSIQLAPTFTIAMNSLGMLMMRENRPDVAMEKYRQAIALDPGYAEARVNLGNALLERGDLDGARDQYSQAAANRPDNVEAQFNLANLLLTHDKRPDLAIPHYLAAVNSDPNRADVRANLAVALFEMGRYDDAREQCLIALRIDPDLSPAKQVLEKLKDR
jgi:protein O-mannosyl-transferase